MDNKKLYASRDIEGQKQFYLDHIYHMTSESLHSKSDIAAELAHRDIVINELLEACELILADYPQDRDGMDWSGPIPVGIKRLRAVVAKAKGES